MTSSVRQIVKVDPGAPGFACYLQASFPLATLTGSTLLIFGAVANYAGTTCQTAQNSALGSPAPTGDATNGVYNPLQLAHDPGNEAYGLWSFPNAAAVSAGTLFTVNYTAGDDYIGITIVEIAGVATASVIASLANMTQVVGGSGTDNITSGTTPLGSSPCIIVAMSSDGVNSNAPGPGTGFTDQGTGWGWGTGSNDARWESKNVSNPGTAGATFDATYASTFNTLMVALLDGAAGGAVLSGAATSKVTAGGVLVGPSAALAGAASAISTAQGALVQTSINYGQSAENSTAGATTCTATVSAPTQLTGSAFFVSVVQRAGTQHVPTITDNKGNTYNAINSTYYPADNTDVYGFICYSGSGGAGHAFTATTSASVSMVVFALEITGGLATASIVGAYNGSGGFGGTTSASGSITFTPPVAQQLLVSVMGTEASGSAMTFTESTASMTVLQKQNNGSSFGATGAMGAVIVSGSGSTTKTATWADGSNGVYRSVALFSFVGGTAVAGAALAGAASAISSGGGSINNQPLLSGAASSTATATASMTNGARLSGAAASIVSAGGVLLNYLAGAASAVVSGAGVLATTIALAGVGNGAISSGSGTLTTAKPLPATPALGLASASGSLTVGAGLAGAASSKATATGYLGQALFQGAAASVASASGSLTTGSQLAGSASTVASALGNLMTSTASGLSFGAGVSAHSSGAALSLATTPVNTINNNGYVIGVVTLASGGTVSVSDTYGNTYIQIGSYASYHGGAATTSLWYCPTGRGGNNHAAAIHQANAGDVSVFFQELRSASGGGVAIDQSGQNYDASSPYASNAITTVYPQELIVSLFAGFSDSNPATLAVSGDAFVLQSTIVDGGPGVEATGGFAGEVVTSLRSGLVASFTQAGNTTDGVAFLASFYPGPVTSILAGGASAPVSASGFLSTTANFAGAATSKSTASGQLINLASVTLVAPTYTGIGSITDPYWWEDLAPVAGDVVQFDPTNLTVYPTGQLVFTQNNVTAFVVFTHNGVQYNGTVSVVNSLVGYSYGTCSASGSLTTLPSGFSGSGGSVASASGSLTTGIKLAGVTATIPVEGAAALGTGIPLGGMSRGIVSASGFISSVAQFYGAALAVASAYGNPQLAQALLGAATTVSSGYGNLGHGAVLLGAANGKATGTGSLLAGIRPLGAAIAKATATGTLSGGARLAGAATGNATGAGSLGTVSRLSGAAMGHVTGTGALAIGAGFRGAALGLASGAGALKVGQGLAGAAVAKASASGTLAHSQGASLAGAAFVLISSDPTLANFVTNQLPVGMYKEDANFVIGQQFPFSPTSLIIGPSEQRIFTFDFSGDLAAGETLVGVATLTVENTAGDDPTPTDIIGGILSFNVGQTQVLVPVDAVNGLLDNDYYIIVTCGTSNPLKALNRFGLVQIRS